LSIILFTRSLALARLRVFFTARKSIMKKPRIILSEGIGTAFLLATIVGSGVMGEQLAGGNTAIALLANTIATGMGLGALILTFGPISGAHFNPVVTLAEALLGQIKWQVVPTYLLAQLSGALVGVAAAHLMFGLPLFFASQHVRTGPAQLFSEFIATFGLLVVIQITLYYRALVTPFAVASYIAAAYWFTASTSFANPAVTIARAASDTFAGIRSWDVPGFIGAQLLGAAAATWLTRWLTQKPSETPVLACCAEVEALQNALATVQAVCSVPTITLDGGSTK
jgi:glycerol uptake facilitator-like aquaporin